MFVEDFSKNMQDLSLEKLIKMLAVATDYQNDCEEEFKKSRDKVIELQLLISNKKVGK